MNATRIDPEAQKPQDPLKLTVESWSQGLVIGALLIMSSITVANMRKGAWLHKLILLELLLAVPDCFFIFFNAPAFGWYLSSSSTLMIISWTLHNVIAWTKNKPFLTPSSNTVYIVTIILAQPYWLLEIYANFAYFNGINEHLFLKTRPFEALCRDPWWIFTTINLFWNIKYRYGFQFFEIVSVSPRFGLMLASMCLSIIFIIIDLLAVTSVLQIGGLNPFWKISFILKCFTDIIILDDFKTALDKLSAHTLDRIRADASHAKGHARDSVPIKAQTLDLEGSKLGVIHVETEMDVFREPRSPAESTRSTASIVKNRKEAWDAD